MIREDSVEDGGHEPVVPGGGNGGERGKILYVEDVQGILGLDPLGRPRRSAWWVRVHVAPEHRFRLGIQVVWYERDVLAWLDEQYARGFRTATQAARVSAYGPSDMECENGNSTG